MTDPSYLERKMRESVEFIQFAEQHFGIAEDAAVVDFGCGPYGFVGKNLIPRTKRVIFCEDSNSVIAELRENLKSQPPNKYEVWENGIKEDAEAAADVLLSSMVMHHIDDIDRLAADCFKLLKKGGKILIMDLKTEDGSFHGTKVVPHKGFDPDTVKDVFEKAGFANAYWVDYKAYHMETTNRFYERFAIIAEKL